MRSSEGCSFKGTITEYKTQTRKKFRSRKKVRIERDDLKEWALGCPRELLNLFNGNMTDKEVEKDKYFKNTKKKK